MKSKEEMTEEDARLFVDMLERQIGRDYQAEFAIRNIMEGTLQIITGRLSKDIERSLSKKSTAELWKILRELETRTSIKEAKQNPKGRAAN